MKVYQLIELLNRKFKPNDEVFANLFDEIVDVEKVRVSNERILVHKAVIITQPRHE